MSPNRILAVVTRQVYLMRGSPTRVLPIFLWIAIDMVLWGFMARYLNSLSETGVNFTPALLGAVLLWDFFARVMQGITTAFLEDVWARNFLNMFGSPLTITEYVTALVLTSVMTTSIGLVFMLLVASGAFGLSILALGVGVLPFLLVLFLFGISLGILACAIMLRFGPASEWFIWPIPGVLAPFACVFYPMATLPPWMQIIARMLPPSYVFESLRAALNGQPLSGGSLALSTALAVLDIVLAAWVFRGVYRYAVRVGLIARYSAESVS